ncbi:MAG: ATP-dependent sacrificial sulfur transferase LarE [Elusimicrobiota bacterium]
MSKSKLNKLKNILQEMGSILVAYSGGVDSTFLLKVAKDTIGDNVLAVTAKSETYPKREYEQAKKIAQKLKTKHLIINTKELSNSRFLANPVNRCYYCKKELFTKLKQIAREKDINYIVDGTNCDDLKDFRPGMNAIKELGVRSPLREAGLTKKEIRLFSRKMHLSTWDKPVFACLASRFPYGDKITLPKLKMINEAEEYLHSLGIKQVRVRHHACPNQGRGNNIARIARIEVSPEDINCLTSINSRKKIVKKFNEIGYRYVSLDLQGYRTGSMNPITERQEAEK